MKKRRKKIPFSMILIHFLVILFVLCCIVPFILVISASFSDDNDLVLNGVSFVPRIFSVEAYKYVFKYPEQIFRAYGVSIFVTVVGTILNMAVMLPFAFAISKFRFKFRKVLTFYMFFTVMFGGGLVPTYILIKNYLHMYNTIWVLIIPLLVQPGNIVLLKVFFQSVPSALYESAEIEGANEFQQFFRIGLPLIVPGIATITFFTILMYWNDSYTAIIYIENTKLTPIQIFLTQMSQYVNYIKQSMGTGSIINLDEIPTKTILYAMCVVASGPMIILFSFFQKYFVQGLTAGSVKE